MVPDRPSARPLKRHKKLKRGCLATPPWNFASACPAGSGPGTARGQRGCLAASPSPQDPGRGRGGRASRRPPRPDPSTPAGRAPAPPSRPSPAGKSPEMPGQGAAAAPHRHGARPPQPPPPPAGPPGGVGGRGSGVAGGGARKPRLGGRPGPAPGRSGRSFRPCRAEPTPGTLRTPRWAGRRLLAGARPAIGAARPAGPSRR